MSSWIAQHFLNSSLFWPAVGLLAAPIIIHLINRLRFRHVRFAAMEFLLASEQRNRQRVLLEHLLLLIARVAIVALIGLLIARYVADPRQLSLFQGAKSHHILLIDDSGSMRDRLGEGTAFDAAREIVRKLAAEGAQHPETQILTVLRMSQPDEVLSGLSERNVDDALVAELSTRLEDMQCTYGTIDVARALDAARARLADDASSVKQVHVVSDFRRRDWFDNKAAAAAITAIANLDCSINLVRAVPVANANLGIAEFTGDTSAAAAGVPMSFNAVVQNFGSRDAENVRLAVQVDGRPLPVNLVLEKVAAGETARRAFEVVFDQATTHRIQVSLESDELEADNQRRLAVVIPDDNPVLVIDGSAAGDEGRYIADALGADKNVTGYATIVADPDYLRRHPLDGFQLIEMVNVPELPEDAVDVLEKFVAAGGGLAWFLGDAVRPSFYNDRLYRDGAGLFPTRIGNAPATMTRDPDAPGPDVVAGDNEIFRILSGAENPFIDIVFINVYFPVDPEQLQKDQDRPNGVETLASLRNRQPLMLEHQFGKGRVITMLTAAGPSLTPEGTFWSNWANGPGAPSYAVMQLELAKSIARRDRTPPSRIVGEPIRLSFDRTQYRENVEVIGPDEQVSQVTAIPVEPADDEKSKTETEAADPDAIVAVYPETGVPGFYAATKFSQSQQPEQQVWAYNVPIDESRLEIAEDADIRRELGEGVDVTIQPAGSMEWIRAESPGRELRWAILSALAALMMIEQGLAYRLSYHSSDEVLVKPQRSRRKHAV